MLVGGCCWSSCAAVNKVKWGINIPELRLEPSGCAAAVVVGPMVSVAVRCGGGSVVVIVVVVR